MGTRRTTYLLSLLCCISLMVSCMGRPMPTNPLPTLSQTPFSTPVPSPTPSPSPDSPTLSQAAVDRIGVGLESRVLASQAGIQSSDPAAPDPTRYAISEGGILQLVYSQENSYILSFEVVGSSNDRSVQSKPDPAPVADFTIWWGTHSAKVSGTVSANELMDVFGVPLEDETREVIEEGFGDVRLRAIRYSTASVQLYQQQKTPDPDKWALWRFETISDGIATPRGLRVGMTSAEIVERIGTGSFFYSTDSILNPTEMWINKVDIQNDYSGFCSLEFKFTDGIATTMILEFSAP